MNPNSAAQQTARNLLSQYSQAWAGLTQERRDAWTVYAGDHPVTDSLGQSQALTGMQYYVRVNTAMRAAGFAAGVDDPPVDIPAAPVLTVASVSIGSISVTATPSPLPAGNRMVFESSPPVSSGRGYNSDYRVVSTVAPAGAPEVDDSILITKWGTVSEGQKFFLRARVVNSTGGVGAWASVEFTVTP